MSKDEILLKIKEILEHLQWIVDNPIEADSFGIDEKYIAEQAYKLTEYCMQNYELEKELYEATNTRRV